MLPKTGQLSMTMLPAEFGLVLPKKFSDFYGIAEGIPTSGEMKLSQFYGKYLELPQIDAYLFDSTENLTSFTESIVPPTLQDAFDSWGRFAGNYWFPSGTTPTGEATSWSYVAGTTTVETQIPRLPIFGLADAGINTASELGQLTTEFPDTNNRTLSVNGDGVKYGYLCYPVELGEATFIDQAAGFPGGWDGASWPDDGDFGDTYGPIIINRTIGVTTSQWYLYRMDFPAYGNFNYSLTFQNAGTMVYSTVSVTVPGGEGKIVTSTNSNDRIGFISTEQLEDYDFEATLSSTNQDDDWVGLVAAHHNAGKNIILMAVRANHNANNWVLWLQDGTTLTTLVNGSNALTQGFENPTKQGWQQSGPTRIRVKRQGAIISAWCSPFGSTELDPSTLIQVDLNARSDTRPLLGPKAYGYMAHSQQDSTFTDIKLIGGLSSDTVYDLVNNKVLVYNGTSWSITEESIIDKIGYPRKVRNPETGYVYRIDPDGLVSRIN